MISKEELVSELANGTGVSKEDAAKIYDALVAFVATGLKTSPVVVLPDLPPIAVDVPKPRLSDQDELAKGALDALRSRIFSSFT